MLELKQYLIEKTKNKSSFSLKDLKKLFPKDKEQINKYVFIGLIAPVSIEFPDTVRAHIYNE